MNWRIGLVIIAISLGLAALISQNSGTSEVRNSVSPSNFVLVESDEIAKEKNLYQALFWKLLVEMP